MTRGFFINFFSVHITRPKTLLWLGSGKYLCGCAYSNIYKEDKIIYEKPGLDLISYPAISTSKNLQFNKFLVGHIVFWQGNAVHLDISNWIFSGVILFTELRLLRKICQANK